MPNRHIHHLRVLLSGAQQIVAALEARSAPTQLPVFDDEGHDIIRLKNKLMRHPIVVEFLDRYLKG